MPPIFLFFNSLSVSAIYKLNNGWTHHTALSYSFHCPKLFHVFFLRPYSHLRFRIFSIFLTRYSLTPLFLRISHSLSLSTLLKAAFKSANNIYIFFLPSSRFLFLCIKCVNMKILSNMIFLF